MLLDPHGHSSRFDGPQRITADAGATAPRELKSQDAAAGVQGIGEQAGLQKTPRSSFHARR